MQNYKIETMSPVEIMTLINWMQTEGWNPGLKDGECFFSADKTGFFAGKLDGKIIAAASAVIYDEHFAFCGCYIVDPAYRHHGYGMPLTEARLKYVGNRVTGLDGVFDMVDKYTKIGYKAAHKNIRYVLQKSIKKSVDDANIVTITPALMPKIISYDREYFPADRKKFLICWINQPKGRALAYVENETVQGYGVIRQCDEGYKIGPLFAESPIIAEQLFLNLISNINSFPIYLDIPEPNASAKKLVTKFKMKPVFETLRMYRNGEPDLNLNNIFGITTFELG